MNKLNPDFNINKTFTKLKLIFGDQWGESPSFKEVKMEANIKLQMSAGIFKNLMNK
jgi:hypothetical protein